MFIIGFVTKNLNRIIFKEHDYYNYPWPKYYSYSANNKINKPNHKIINGKKIYFMNDDYCMYSYGPCGIYKDNLNVKMSRNYTFYNLSTN